jgi:hypothetical protein
MTIKNGPLVSVKVNKEVADELAVNEINESVADIGISLEVDWQIKEIIGRSELLIDHVHHHFLCIAVWYIFDHESRFVSIDALNVYLIVV